MKRLITFLLTLTMLFALTACDGAVEETDAGLDSDRNFIHYGSWDEVCSTEDTVYFASGRLVHYYDKASGISGILCGKPECEHSTAYDSRCNAYIGSSANDLQLYGGRLWWLNSYSLSKTICSMALDGTDHRTERTVDELITGSNYGSSMLIHRGFAYVWVKNHTTQDGEVSVSFQLAAVPLDTDEDLRLLVDEGISYASRNEHAIIQGYKDDVYILTNWPEDRDETDPDSDPLYDDLRVLRYNASTDELTTLYRDSRSPLTYTVEMWAMDDGLLFMGDNRLSDNADRWVYRLDFESGELAAVFEPVPGAQEFVEGMVVSSTDSSEKSNPTNPWGLTLALRDIERILEFSVCLHSFSGDVLFEDTYRLEGYYSHPDFCGVDGTYAYFFSNGFYSDNDGETLYMSLIGVALDGSGMEVLCSEEEFYAYGGSGTSSEIRTFDDGTTVTVENREKITVTTPDGETVTMTVEELLENGWQP